MLMLLHQRSQAVLLLDYVFLYSAFIHRKKPTEFQYFEEDDKSRGIKYTKFSPSSVLLLSFQDLRLTSAVTANKQQQMTTTNKKTPICLNVSHPPPALSKVCFGYYRPVPKHSHCPRLVLTTDPRVSRHKSVPILTLYLNHLGVTVM